MAYRLPDAVAQQARFGEGWVKLEGNWRAHRVSETTKSPPPQGQGAVQAFSCRLR